jgi:hypothetical protein
MRTKIIHFKFGARAVNKGEELRAKAAKHKSIYVQYCDNGIFCNIRRLRPHISFLFQIPEPDT